MHKPKEGIMEPVKAIEERFDKFARRTQNEILKALPGMVQDLERRIKLYIDREIGRRLTKERTAIYKYVDKELARALSTPALKNTVASLIEAEFGRQDPDAINVEVVERLGTGAKPKKNKNASEFE
jgi:hypothetical protein